MAGRLRFHKGSSVVAVVACLVLAACPGRVAAQAPTDSDCYAEIDALLGRVRLAEAACREQCLNEVLEEAVRLVRAQSDSVLRGMMAGSLLDASHAVSRTALARAQELMPEYVPVMARGGDPARDPSVQAVPRAHFDVNPPSRGLGLRGSRLSAEPPAAVAVRLSRGTLGVLETAPSPFRPVASDPGGAFLPDARTDPRSLAMTTAFVAGVRVIDAAELWAGHRVDWGNRGLLTIVPYDSVTDSPLAFYDQVARQVRLGALGSVVAEFGLAGFTGHPYGWASSVEDLAVDTASNPDVVAHEAAHAVVAALKPGWGAGVALVLHEAIADTFAVLTAMEDPCVLRRALRQTAGDLRLRSELTELFEELGSSVHRYADADPTNDDDRQYRSVLDPVRLDDCELHPEAVDMPATLSIAGRSADPHVAAQIVSGLLYQLFCDLYEREQTAGASVPAIVRARSVTGMLMLRSLRFLGEHRVSLRGFALALLRVDRDTFGSANTAPLRRALAQRGLVRADEDVDGELAERDARLPVFDLSPVVTEKRLVLEAAEALESRLLASCIGKTMSPVPLIRHYHSAPFAEEVGAERVAVWSDSSAVDGTRVIRLHYEVPVRRLLPSGTAGMPTADHLLADADLGVFDVFASLVLGSSGNLIALCADKPWE